ncbi:MAG: ATP-dependent DNA helicase, partial [Bdellovibrionales bacterium]|nr:ATP-dependent DNA helicase [Bdellovibrionales bacterium]
LEFPVVFIAGMEEGIFPTGRAFESSDPTALEEERRLAYVGMTRAMEKLYLLHAQTRRIWGNEQRNSRSRFISEIPENYLDESSSFKRPKFMDRFQSTQSFEPEDDVQYFPDEIEHGSMYKKGGMVRHPTFGVGKIHQVEGMGEMQKVSVLFNNSTLKKFVVKYARLEVL